MKGMKGFIIGLVATVCATILPVVDVYATEGVEDYENKLVVLYTDSVRGNIQAYSKISAIKHYYEDMGAYVVLLDGGDSIIGSSIANEYEGKCCVDLMNIAGYDAMAIGDNDFLYSARKFNSNVQGADFDIIASNVTYKGKEVYEKNVVYEFDNGRNLACIGKTF